MTSNPRQAATSKPKTTSRELAAELEKYIPGGVDSPFRSFKEVGGDTIFFHRAKGSRLYDVDGNEYIDYLGAWGPAVLGHAPAEVVSACQKVIADGPVFGAPHALELELARTLTETIPSVEQVRFVNSGTEAVMSAVRLARGFTGRDLIVMFEGGYHGHSDATLASRGHRNSAGIPESVSEKTLVTPFNNLASLERILTNYKDKIAAVLIEPVCGSMGVVAPNDGFLAGVAALCKANNVVLIFDEVLTGFRVAYGGAQSLFGVKPDLTCFGKALGGGMPIGAYGGRRDIMQHLEPSGKVYQAGTFSGNPVTMAGGVAILKRLADPDVYKHLEAMANLLFDGLSSQMSKYKTPIQLARVGSMFSILFTKIPVHNYQDSLSIDPQAFAKFFHYLLDNNVYLPPSAQDAACISAAHTIEDINKTVEIMQRALIES